MQQKFYEKNRDLLYNVNGKLIHRDEPGISPFDSSVQGGDGVWEGLRVYEGKVFRLAQHLERLRHSALALAFDEILFSRHEVHVHVPAGAIPKDGPSAGIAIATAIASLATQRPVRADLAMTGEVTLRGRVLPVGGVREKALAALRAGIGTVILPRRNLADLRDRSLFEFVPDDLERLSLSRPGIGLTIELARRELDRVRRQVEELVGRGAKLDGYTEAHLRDLSASIARALSAEVEIGS